MSNIEKRYSVIIVGAGPIGIELAIVLKRAGVDCLTIEAKQIGDAISRWPPHTHFYSTPEHVALAGVPVHTTDQQTLSGEEYLAYLRTLVEMSDIETRQYETVYAIERDKSGFVVQTRSYGLKRVYQADFVVLATGGMAKPRLIGIPGEELPHVDHYFPGPHYYFRQRLLIVGGRNSAVESALRSWRAGAEVTISYRRPEFDFETIKPHLAMDIRDRLEKGEIAFLPSTMPLEITPQHTLLSSTLDGYTANGNSRALESDFVLLSTGFVADMSLFRQAGVKLIGSAEIPQYDPQTMETNVSGLFVAGTAAGGTQSQFKHFISTCHHHVAKIALAINGSSPDRLGTVPARNNAVTWSEVRAN